MSEKLNKHLMKLMQQPNVMIEKWKIENQSKDFFKMNWNQKIAS